jgi:hypothetical protein
MIDHFVLLTPILVLAVMALVRFVGCHFQRGFEGCQGVTFDPPAGKYPMPLPVRLMPTDQEVYYTTDGTNPSPSSLHYDSATPIQVTVDTTIKAIRKSDYENTTTKCEPSEASYYTRPIAFDSAASGNVQDNAMLSWQHSVATDSNAVDRILFIGVRTNDATEPTSVTYGGAAATIIAGPLSITAPPFMPTIFLYQLIGPAQGSNAVIVTLPSAPGLVQGISVSYTNAEQSDQPDNLLVFGEDVRKVVMVTPMDTTSVSVPLSPIGTQGDWGLILVDDNVTDSGWTPAGCQIRTNELGFVLADTDGPISGTAELTLAAPDAQNWGAIGIAFKDS